jgi:ATP-dependent DNA helicase RecQ
MSPRTRRTRDELEQIARRRFGYDALRPAQRQVIERVLQGHDTLAIMPTGSGKSAIYQIAGLLLQGPTLVVSPLLALQQDQLEAIEEKDLPDAAAVSSVQSESTSREALEDAEYGEVEFLFLAPEQLANAERVGSLARIQPSLVVVDEAHCLSEWGHDFRPDYLRLGAVIEALGHPTVLALTATASERVRADIVRGLGMRSPRVVVSGFNRPNIWLGARTFETARAKRWALLLAVQGEPKPGIVYVATRRRAEEVADALAEEGVRAVAYHAGMKPTDRERVQSEFMRGAQEVIVATNAFGLGVDKPNVRFVFHLDMPDSVDAYYQEIGRGGRDGEPARAVLFYRPQDAGVRRAMVSTGKIQTDVFERVAGILRAHDGPLTADELAEQMDVPPKRLTKILQGLERTGAARLLPGGEIVSRNGESEVNGAAGRAAEEREGFRQYRLGRVELMRAYAETPGCRRRYILNYFGEGLEQDCGYCDRCDAGASAREARQAADRFPMHARVRHRVFGEGTVMRQEGDSVVVLFDAAGSKKLALEHLRSRGLLEILVR